MERSIDSLSVLGGLEVLLQRAPHLMWKTSSLPHGKLWSDGETPSFRRCRMGRDILSPDVLLDKEFRLTRVT